MQRPLIFPERPSALCAPVKRQRSTWQRCLDDLELHHSKHTHKTQVKRYPTWTRKDARTSALTKSRILARHYQIPDVVLPKHGPTFGPRLWSSTMLLRGWIRGSTVRGTVVINSTVPWRWDTAKRFWPASRWHLKTTNTIDPWICHRNLSSSVRSTTEYHSDPQSWPKPKTKNCFQTQTRRRVFSAGKQCEWSELNAWSEPLRATIPVENSARLSWDRWIHPIFKKKFWPLYSSTLTHWNHQTFRETIVLYLKKEQVFAVDWYCHWFLCPGVDAIFPRRWLELPELQCIVHNQTVIDHWFGPWNQCHPSISTGRRNIQRLTWSWKRKTKFHYKTTRCFRIRLNFVSHNIFWFLNVPLLQMGPAIASKR